MSVQKVDRLRDFLRELPGAIVAYSGGADSAFLAEVSHEVLGVRSVAITADSPSLPRSELQQAGELARGRGWNHRVVHTSELEDPRYVSNPKDRCYYCKSALMDILGPMSEQLGPVLLGTNVDDLSDWRPGGKAADERGALHPMVDAGLTKDEIRDASRLIGLQTADKPASACLASRFAYGVRVTAPGLARIESAEEVLRSRGFDVVRVRDLGEDVARVEVLPPSVPRLLELREEIEVHLKSLGFADVKVDEKGYRRGAMNEPVVVTIGRQPVSSP